MLRRELIALSAEAEELPEQPKVRAGVASIIDRSWLDLMVALRYLNWDGLVWLDEAEGQELSWQLTEEGCDLARDGVRLSSRLPTTETEDEHIDL